MKRSLRSLGVVLALGVPLALAGACAELLGIRSDAPPRRFPHRAHVLEGVACTRCHTEMPAQGDTGPLHLPSTASCRTCHSPAHRRSAAEAGVPAAGAEGECLSCHGAPHEQERAALARQHLRFRHDVHLAQAPATCVRCHAGVAAPSEDMIVPMARCLSCHEHQDAFSARRCDDCHVDLPAEAIAPSDHLIHDDDWLARHGVAAASADDLCATCHAESSCASCHGVTVPELPSRIRFDQPTTMGLHRAGFLARHGEAARTDPGLCTTCHAPSTCASCHRERGVAPRGPRAAPGEDLRNPHPPGWVGAFAGSNEHGRAARRDPAACASCHGGAGEALCAECHRVGGVGGSVHPPGWSSRRGIDEMPCRMCHGAVP